MKFIVALLLAFLSFVAAGTIAAGDLMTNATSTSSNCGGNCPGGE